jgi:hypothetical protein
MEVSAGDADAVATAAVAAAVSVATAVGVDADVDSAAGNAVDCVPGNLSEHPETKIRTTANRKCSPANLRGARVLSRFLLLPIILMT